MDAKEKLLQEFVTHFSGAAPILRTLAADYDAQAETQQQAVIEALESIERAKQTAQQFRSMASDIERLTTDGAALLDADKTQKGNGKQWH